MSGTDARTAFFESIKVIAKYCLFIQTESNIAGDVLEFES